MRWRLPRIRLLDQRFDATYHRDLPKLRKLRTCVCLRLAGVMFFPTRMKRLHLIEIEDQDWCPPTIRNTATDYLQFVLSKAKPYEPVVPVLECALKRAGSRQVLDLCSGGAGPWFWLQHALKDRGLKVSVCLTDKFPNPGALAQSGRHPSDGIDYHPCSIDATRVPKELPGFRTMFTAFHHFRPAEARAVLADAVRQRRGIAIFEGSERSVLGLLSMLLAPFMVLVMIPFVRPFRWSRLLWTYLIPLVPLVTLFDGLVSCLRTYSVPELRQFAAELGAQDYEWEIGSLKIPRSPIPVTYLIGVPRT